MTDTRPGEISRIARDDVEFRITTLTTLAEIKEWMRYHDKRDDERFESLESRIGSVTSSVSDTNGKKQQLAGAWRALTLICVAAVAGGGFVLALLTYLHDAAK
jgi:hypothetical protein